MNAVASRSVSGSFQLPLTEASPFTRRLVLRALEAGECLSAFKMKKKTISLLMAASLAASSLAGGIVSFAEESDPITLSVWAPFTGSDGDVLREIIDNYNETNTDNITVQIDIMDNATLQSKLPTAVSTGTGPSFVLVGIEFLQQYAKNGLIEDISDFWDATGIDKSNFCQLPTT